MGGAFLLLITSLLIGSLTKPEYPPFALTAASPAAVGDSLVGPVTYTLDASATARWRRFDCGRNAAVEVGPWDVAFRRFHVIAAAGGGIVDLGQVPSTPWSSSPPQATPPTPRRQTRRTRPSGSGTSTVCSATCSPRSITFTACGRRAPRTRNSSCSPITAATQARRASRSATLIREMGHDGWRANKQPPAAAMRPGAEVVGSKSAGHLGGRILNIPVPHTGHTPFRAGRPFAILTC